MKFLITGASGFIGRHLLIAILSRRGFSVASLGVVKVGMEGVEEFIVEDLSQSNSESIINKVKPDVIIHLAAAGVNPEDRNIDRLVEVNAVLPSKMVAMAKRCGVRAVLIAGTCSEYQPSNGETMLKENHPLEVSRLYGATKASGDILANATGAELQLPTAVLRIFNVYGPGEAPYRLSSSLLRGLRDGERVPLSQGLQIRDFIYIDDVCEGFIRSAEAMASGKMVPGSYNLCTGRPCSVRDFAIQFSRSMGKDDSLLGFGDLALRKDDYSILVGDPSKLQEQTDWRAGVGVEEGIRRIVSLTS